MAINFPYVWGSGGSPSSHVNVFGPTLSYMNGVTLVSVAMNNSTASMSMQEFSRDHEGFNIALFGLAIGTSYVINFDFQFTSAAWFPSGQYRIGVKIYDNNYSNYNNYTDWPDNIDRDLLIHNHRITFTASAETMYLSFNLCGCSDLTTNLFEITDLYVKAA